MLASADPLALFSRFVADWFRATWDRPTPPQALGWPVIARGEHALIVSPTGSGKTLTAFLWSLDRLFAELKETPEPVRGSVRAGKRAELKRSSVPQPDSDRPEQYVPGIRIVYISPLKALNNDVERNLQVPLNGIQAAARALGEPLPELRAAVRTGDTPTSDRQKMLRRPPQILITTPESLYLMLTSERARLLFATTHTVIVDEIHTLVGNKRGAHLALSLERLDRLAKGRLQRIGLSATVRPLATAARFLGGQDAAAELAERPVTIVDASYDKKLDLRVVSPLADRRGLTGGSIWAAIVPDVARQIEAHRTTLVFCNNRRLAERTADRLNEQRLLVSEAESGDAGSFRPTGPDDLGIFARGVDPRLLEARGLAPIRAHHGSLSKTARVDLEQALKSGSLPALVCTASLELGIDIGEIDLVVHLQSPKSVAAGLQRVGRSGHLVGQTSVGRIYPTHVEDLLEAAAVCRGMLQAEIESTETPENPLDVLAQQLVAMVSVEDWSFDEALALVRGAYPFRSLGERGFRSVLEMLSGKYPESVSRMLKAQISWDRVNNQLRALPGASVLAIGSGGTIPDRGTYSLVLADRHTKVGDLDEEFVFETRPGDTFLLGSHVWRVIEIGDDRVIAEPAPGEVPRMPFWRGDVPWRPYDLGCRIGAFRRELADLVRALGPEELEKIRSGEVPPTSPAACRLLDLLTRECALDPNSLVQVVDYVARQLDANGQIASDRTILAEVFSDAIGEPRLVIHSPFGGRVNGPWGVVLAGAIRERLGVEAQVISGDDGILLRFANAEVAPPVDLVGQITSQEARERLLADLPGSATFVAQFRMNAARALLLPRERAGKRTPLWLSRLRAKDLLQAVQQFDDFPILLETYRDCLRDVMDVAGLTEVLDRIHRGEIELVVSESEVPSPLALGLDQRFSAQYVYEYDQPRGERQLAALTVNRELLADLLRDGTLAELVKPAAIAAVAARVARTSLNDRARNAEELAQLLYELGDLAESELRARSATDESDTWLAELVDAGRAIRWRFGNSLRWVHAERQEEYARLAADPGPVLRRYLAHAGPTGLAELTDRYALPPDEARRALDALRPEVVPGQLTAGRGEEWIDRRNLEQIHRQTLSILRKEVQPVPIAAYAEFLRRWQGVGDAAAPFLAESVVGDEHQASVTRLRRTLQQLRGLAIPGAIWERDVLPARVSGFDSTTLGELCQAGEVMWVAEGGKDAHRARVSFFFRGEGGLFRDRRPVEATLAELGESPRLVYDYLTGEGAALLADVAEGTGLSRTEAQAALVELVLEGLVTNDSLDALRTVLGYESPPLGRDRPFSSLAPQLAELIPRTTRQHPSRHRLIQARRRARHAVLADAQSRRTTWVGRWSPVYRPGLLGKALPVDEVALRQARQLLARWGVVTRACFERESAWLTWDALYPVLSRLEVRGEVRRGYFVEGLPGIQFAVPEAVEQLRAANRDRLNRSPGLGDSPSVDDASIWTPIVLSAADPAQLFGGESFGGPLRFQRVASTAVALAGGEPVAVAEDSGAAFLTLSDHPALVPALRALAHWWKHRAGRRFSVERWNGEPVLETSGTLPLEAAGFVRDYRSMIWVP